MKSRIAIGVLAGLVLAAPAAADVVVRVEGTASTVLKASVPRTGPSVTRTSVRNGQTITKTCDGDSAVGALDRAVSNDFGADAYSFGLLITRIRTFALDGDQRFWGFEYRNSFANAGACDVKPEDGQEVLFYAGCGTAATDCFDGLPLDVIAPATATSGVPFSVKVNQYDDSKDPAPATPASGASIAGGAAAVTTGADGTAQVTVAQPGTVTLVATKGRQVRDSATVTVQAPPVYSVPAGATATPTPGPSLYPTDFTAPVSRITNVKDGAKLKRGPRKLKATVREAGSLRSVKLALTRKVGKRCSAFDGESERFRATRCGRAPRFVVGTAKKVDYLLPGRLDTGRYGLTVVATDSAGNREKVKAGRNKVVFRVR